MAKLSYKADEYAKGRPNYPLELFQFISSKTPERELAWDVGTGNGQAALSLAAIYKNVVATDMNLNQLEAATKQPNIRYELTSSTVSIEELKQKVGGESSVDLVTSAQAMHWFDLPTFYQRVKWILKKPHGVIAAWCYTYPEVNPTMDKVLHQRYLGRNTWVDRAPVQMVRDRYETIDFPFQPLDGLNGTGPIRFTNERMMSLDDYFTYLRSWSSYAKAMDEGKDLLSPEIVEEFTSAWSADGNSGSKMVDFPIYLRIGKVGPEKQP